jgi:16S rRNA (guanine527-N7)-methyltransferase
MTRVRVSRETTMNQNESLEAIEQWLGLSLDGQQRERLVRYQQWLAEEALPAGGIGPGESERLFDRHIADSLAFLAGMNGSVRTVVDVGSGVGLPAIPIAIARPELEVTIVDRSERRTSLASRALRILGIDNVHTQAVDAADVTAQFDVVTFRASLRVGPAVEAFLRLAEPGGTGLFALSRSHVDPTDAKSLPAAPEGTIFSIVSEGAAVLISPAWFLRMQRVHDSNATEEKSPDARR